MLIIIIKLKIGLAQTNQSHPSYIIQIKAKNLWREGKHTLEQQNQKYLTIKKYVKRWKQR